MKTQHPNFRRFHNKIIGAVFFREFYRYILKTKFKELLVFYILLSALAISTPTIRAYSILSGDNNQIVTFSQETLSTFPELTIVEGKIATEEPIVRELHHPSMPYPIITIDSENTTASQANSRAAISFLQDGFIINEMRIIDIFLTQAKLIRTQNIGNNTNQYSVPYRNDNYVINSSLIHDVVAKYSDFKLSSYILLVVAFIFFSLFSVCLKALFFGSFIFFYSNSKKLNLRFFEAFKISVAALIPSSVINSFNIITLWQSNILNNPNAASLLFMIVNFYFAIFAVNSLTRKHTNK